MEELLSQISVAASIDVDKRIPGYRLRKHCIGIIKHARKVAKEYLQGNKPILPQSNSVACIRLYRAWGPEEEDAKLCFDMRSLYCRGVIVRKAFYELRLSGDEVTFVEGSIALECKEHYKAMLGSSNPPQELFEYDFTLAYDSFMRLHRAASKRVKREAARMIGILSLTLLEPSRQTKMMKNLCSGGSAGGAYFKMDEEAWKDVHRWGRRSREGNGHRLH